jgi:hypothetical protein
MKREEVVDKIEKADMAITGTILARVEPSIAKAVVNLKAASQNMLADYKRQYELLEEARTALLHIDRYNRNAAAAADGHWVDYSDVAEILAKLEAQP